LPGQARARQAFLVEDTAADSLSVPLPFRTATISALDIYVSESHTFDADEHLLTGSRARARCRCHARSSHLPGAVKLGWHSQAGSVAGALMIDELTATLTATRSIISPSTKIITHDHPPDGDHCGPSRTLRMDLRIRRLGVRIPPGAPM
jgi:hypothetical protein